MERALIKVDCFTGQAVPEAWITPRINELISLINAGREEEICIGQAELALGIRVAVKQKKIEREVAFEFKDAWWMFFHPVQATRREWRRMQGWLR